MAWMARPKDIYQYVNNKRLYGKARKINGGI